MLTLRVEARRLPLFQWIKANSAGWEFFVVSVPVLAVLLVSAQEKRPKLLPYMFVGVYLAVCLWVYFASGIGRFVSFDYPRWASMLVTLFVTTAIPLGSTATAVLVARIRGWSRGTRVFAGVAGGLLTIPLVQVVSIQLFNVFAPWFGPGS